jgi:hypothetical protein
MKFKMLAKHAGDPDSRAFWEEFDKPGVTDQASAQEAAEKLVENFNNTLRDGECARRLLKVVFLGREGEGYARKLPREEHEEHDWRKSSLITERGGFDRMKCSKCEITGRRYGVGTGGIQREAPYKAKGFAHCDTARELLEKRRGREERIRA